jgi:hypothetical protein
MYFPTPTELVKALVDSSLDDSKKQRALSAVQYMNEDQISRLYAKLIELAELDQEFISNVAKNDLRYKIEFEKAFEAAREEDRTS